ncbi:MAG TPA: disulfide bond formation protein B [Casimicrobiaceae bacterium]|nr:disulfide bond formation protein B [Casimicrobiaceae bacterium]
MSVGVSSVALVLLPPRRIAYFLAFFVCAILILYALYLQYIEGLEPCPLCVFQRICVIGMGIVFLIAGFHHPGRGGATVYAVLQLLIGGAGIAFAGRQVWLQSLPPDQVPSCSMGLNYMLDTLPFTDVLKKVFEGSGECAEKAWEFLHLSLAAWMLVFFIAIIATSFALIRRDP